MVDDYNAGETICFEDLGPESLQGAIYRHVHNLSRERKSIDWLKDLHSKLNECIKELETETNQ